MRAANRLARKLREGARGNPVSPEILEEAADELSRLDRLLHHPSIEHFLESVRLEAGHQVEQGYTQDDGEKTPEDWFLLIRHLALKALRADRTGGTQKALHHTISTSAVMYNWHQAIQYRRQAGS